MYVELSTLNTQRSTTILAQSDFNCHNIWLMLSRWEGAFDVFYAAVTRTFHIDWGFYNRIENKFDCQKQY